MTFLQRIGEPGERKFVVLAIWLLAVFLMGGGSRGDISSLLLLRPMAALVLVAGIYRLSAEEARPYRMLIWYFVAIAALVAVHLIPLPPQIWQSFPQRQLIVEIDKSTGLGGLWRPLSIAPARTWNALFALMVPLSIILLAIRLDARQMKRMGFVVLLIGLLSVAVGVLQVSGGARVPNLYAIHNAGAANGLFANRNHQAAFITCLFPLLGVFASAQAADSDRRIALIIPAACALVLIPALLIVGSRGGIVLGAISLVTSVFAFKFPKRSPRTIANVKRPPSWFADRRVLTGGFAVSALALVSVAALFSRAEALRRLLKTGETEEVRAKTLQPVFDLFLSYLPTGSGTGTFVEAFYRIEPRDLLSPTYLNHAHFDYLEWAVTGGIPAILFILAGLSAAIVAGFKLFIALSIDRPGVQLGRAGLIVLMLLGVASAFDYPLRTPSLSSLAALAAVWVWSAAFVPKKARASG